MLANDRQVMIYSLIRKQGSVKNTELKAMFPVSDMTIRRDLDELEAKKLVRRVHGGAVFAGEPVSEMSFSDRIVVEVEKKLAIAHKAVELVKEGMYVAIDGSSTGLELARLLKNFHDITVVTDSLNVLWELRNVSSIRVLTQGGWIAKDGNTVEGLFSVENAHRLSVDVFFFSCAGFDEEGITNSTPIGSDVRRAIQKNSKQNVLLADSTKYRRRGFIKLFAWIDVHVFVSDSGLSPAARQGIVEAAPHLELEIADTIAV